MVFGLQGSKLAEEKGDGGKAERPHVKLDLHPSKNTIQENQALTAVETTLFTVAAYLRREHHLF